jgi:phosphoribosylformylglycinamidine cyclo-ligase
MGVGMTVIVPAQDADQAIRILRESGEDAYVIGEIGESDSQGEKVIMN